jgi:hypothetical protein
MNPPGEQIVRRLRAAARATGRSASGIQKLVDTGRLPARRDGNVFQFELTDLESLRRGPAPVPVGADVNDEARTDVLGLAVSTPVVDHPRQSGQAVSTGHVGYDDGAVAAIIFGDITAGRTLVQIVAERGIAPDVVQRHHQQWRELKAFDDAQTPTALERLGRVETELALRARQVDLQALDERVAAIENTVHEMSTAVTRG